MAHTIVIFGASGDLTSRKLIPAIYELYRKQRLPQDTIIVGSSRTEFSHDAWRSRLAESTARYLGERFQRDVWDRFARSVYYHPGDVTQPADVAALGTFLEEVESSPEARRLYYLSTAPRFYEPIVLNLGAAGMTCEDCASRQVVIEKPLGTDLQSARKLNETVQRVFAETSRWVVANSVPHLDMTRLTLTLPIINRARTVVFLVAGNNKADVLAEVLEGDKDPQRLPSQAIEPVDGDLCWLLDEAAAAGLSDPPTF